MTSMLRAMGARVSLVSKHPAGEQDRAGGRALLITGAAVAAVALVAYLVAVATHPMATMLKGFDLQVYLDGGQQALHHSGNLYSWYYENHPASSSPTRRSRRCCSPSGPCCRSTRSSRWWPR